MPEWLAAIIGAGGGAITTGWAAKFLISNYIRKNDKFHDKLQEVIVDVAVIKNKLETLKDIEKRVSNLEFTLGDREKGIIRDVNHYFEKLRNHIGEERKHE